MAEFAGYGFAKSHSTAYALITYQTAYLKANHPREYMAALLTIEAGNHDKLARYIAHARERGIEVLPPDVNESERDFTVGARGHPLRARGREERRRGRDRGDPRGARGGRPVRAACSTSRARVDGRRVNRRVVESLVKCGAFDSLHANRAAVWAALDVALEAGAAAQRDREIGQASLFGGAGRRARPSPRCPTPPPWTDAAAARSTRRRCSASTSRATRSRRVSAAARALRRHARDDTAGRDGPRRARGRARSPRCARRARGAAR